MSNELVLSSTADGDRIALLQDKRLVEYHLDNKVSTFSVGDIYLGSIRKINPGLSAVFVDVGYEKDAFLHYTDLGPQIKSFIKYVKDVQSGKQTTPSLADFKTEPEIEKDGSVADVFSKNQPVLVQILKEPISTKGPRLSCEISLAGRYIVLVPFSNAVSISKKITDREERSRLQKTVQAVRPKNFGVIIRTVAEGRETEELTKDLLNLIDTWNAGFETLKTASSRDKIIGEMGRAASLLRDLLNESFDSITVDTKDRFDELKRYINSVDPDREKILKLYNGKAKLFEQYGIERQLKTLFGKSVSLPGGGYLIIEHTEALHVIDVNSGSSSNKGENDDQESTAFNVNCEAAKEVARQLRLRDMGGIIVIDFIDMKKLDNKRLIYERMKAEMKSERARYTVLPLSKFGLMQITRQRVRPEMNIVTLEVCPTCNGTGAVTASILVSDQLESQLEYLLGKQNEKGLAIRLHPYLYAYYTKGIVSKRTKWYWQYKSWVKLVEDTSLGLTDFKFIGSSGKEIEMA